MRIPCPCCGDRDAREFSYLGDASPRRPDADGADSQHAFFEHVYLRDNPAGPFDEYWYHAAGCRSWLIVTRDTRTHEITSARRAADRGGEA
jgi:heterotetrameric sarcosine oxidase delta subunit